MANPLSFTPKPVDPRLELQRRLDAAPIQHGEAMLVAWDLLQTAHDEGLLDLIHGLVGAKDTIAGKLAEYGRLPEGVAAIRNLMGVAKLLTILDPDVLLALTKSLESANALHQQEYNPPGLFTLARRAVSSDSRRALSLLTLVLAEVGRSLNTGEHNQGRVDPSEPISEA